MKLVIASIVLAATSSFAIAAPVSTPSGMSGTPSLFSSTTSSFQMPETKAKTGSKHKSGHKRHGKTSHRAK